VDEGNGALAQRKNQTTPNADIFGGAEHGNPCPRTRGGKKGIQRLRPGKRSEVGGSKPPKKKKTPNKLSITCEKKRNLPFREETGKIWVWGRGGARKRGVKGIRKGLLTALGGKKKGGKQRRHAKGELLKET